MPSLREALDFASAQVSKELTEDVAKQIKSTTQNAMNEIKEVYNDFFDILSSEVVNSGLSAADDGTPAIFKEGGLKNKPWQGVTPKWFDQKERNQNPQGRNFYVGLTYGVIRSTSRYKSRRRPTGGKTRTGLSFGQFIEILGFSGQPTVEQFFGPMQIAWSFSRPDGGKVTAASIEGVVTKLTNRNKAGKFASFLDGTTITAEITAFSKVAGKLTEKSILGYLIATGGHKQQWFKVTGGGQHYRAIITPLIAWYTQHEFNRILIKYFK